MVVPAADIFDVIPAGGWSSQLFPAQLDSLFVHWLAPDPQSFAVPLLVSGVAVFAGNPLSRPLPVGAGGAAVDLPVIADSLSKKESGSDAMDGQFQSPLPGAQSGAPHLDDAVVVAREEVRLVVRHEERADPRGVALERRQARAAVEVPHLDRVIVRAGIHDDLAVHVAADRDHADSRVVAAQRVHALERERPQPERRRVAVLRQPAERDRVVRDELRVRVVVLLLLGGLGRVCLHRFAQIVTAGSSARKIARGGRADAC